LFSGFYGVLWGGLGVMGFFGGTDVA